MSARPYLAVYDFELLPYALGDVLTWNVHTALRCEVLGRSRVDIYVCLDERHPANVFQRELVSAENHELFFNELLGAFATHPLPGGVFIFRRREEMLGALRLAAGDDAQDREALAGYEKVLERRGDDNAVMAYFNECIHSHQGINEFARRAGRVPLLRPSAGCEPDIAALFATRLAGRRVVAVQIRMRRLSDAGHGAQLSYSRDSDFLAWYEFLRDARSSHPDVQFIALGRLQELPIELLELPNVASLRPLGLGLGHELTLLLRSDLFMGTSSGFAAMANFSTVPYCITRVTAQSCKAYAIEPGATRLPFATERQRLVHAPESAALLAQLLAEGLAATPPRNPGSGPGAGSAIDVRSWGWERARLLPGSATTNRFSIDALQADREVAYLVWPGLEAAGAGRGAAAAERAWALVARIESAFPRCAARFPELLRLKRRLAAQREDRALVRQLDAQIAQVESGPEWGLRARLRRWLARAYPLALLLRFVWRYKYRIPGALLRAFRISAR